MNIGSEKALGDLADNGPHSVQTNQPLEISAGEFAFAVLIDSYDVAFKRLNDLVIAAVRANNPSDWIEKICSCFTVGVKQHVKEGLENSCSLEDFFVVCKTISCRVNDISVYLGGDLLDAREKERLSLEVQGVEAARHWAFHGEFISLPEVHSSLNLLISISSFFRCGQEDIERLRSFVTQIELTFKSEENSQSFLTPTTLWRTMLYRSLGEFEKEFVSYFKRQEKNAVNPVSGDVISLAHSEEKKDSSFQHLIKAIQRKLSAPKKELKLFSQKVDITLRRSCSVRCRNITTMRNKFAHNQHLTKEDVDRALEDICEILTVFGLTCRRTKSARISLNRVKENADLYCCEIRRKLDCEEAFSKKRVLRPGVRDFVGRKPELVLIKQHLISHIQSEPYRSKAVLLFGSPGIGKSFLANKIICDLKEVYPKQKWLCCSSEGKLEKNFSVSLEKTCVNPNDGKSKGIPTNVIVNEADGRSSRKERDLWLYVLDDVSSQTALIVLEMLLESPHCFVITTRSTAVKDYLLACLVTMLVVRLGPFSVSESRELIKRKTKSKISQSDLVQASETAHRVLGNLPLCVSIFSSLQAASSKRNRERNATLRASVNEGLSFSDWEKIEKEFADTQHVRGLSGILQIAQPYLQNHPLSLFLLAKIVLFMRESIPWNAIGNVETQLFPGPFVLLDGLLFDLFEDLKKIVDWVFSREGDEVLVSCRETLEELGLITWKKQSDQVCIHGLTLKGVRNLLSEKHSFFGELLSFLWRMPSNDQRIKQAAESLYNNFHSYLMWQILSSSMEYLNRIVAFGVESTPFSADYDKRLEVGYFEVLADLLERRTFQQVGMATMPGESRALFLASVQSMISSCLFDFVSANDRVNSRKWDWLNLYMAFPLSQEKLEKMLLQYNADAALMFAGRPRKRQNNAASELSTRNFIALGRKSWLPDFFFHCKIAEEKDSNKGSEERKLYLREASKMCPRLLTEPNENGMRNELVRLGQLWTTEGFVDDQFDEIYTNLCCWCILLTFQMRDQTAATTGKVDKTTEKLGLMLIEVLHEMQEFLEIPKASEVKYVFVEGDELMKEICINCSYIAMWSRWEAIILTFLQAPGKALGVIVRSIYNSFTDAHVCQLFDSGLIETSFYADLWEWTVYAYLSSIFLYARVVCHPWLGKEFTEQLHPFFERSRYYLRSRRSHQKELQPSQTKFVQNYMEIEHYMRAGDILYFRGHFIFYSTLDAEQTLHFCLLSLKAHAHCLPNSYDVYSEYLDDCSNFVPRLCALLGGQRTHDVLCEIETLRKSTQSRLCDDVFEQLIVNIRAIVKISDAEIIYKTFRQTLGYLSKEDFSEARRTALSCWRKLASLRYSVFTEDIGEFKRDHGTRIIERMFLSLADSLRQIYTREGKFEIVKWFCLFLLETAITWKKGFLVAKYQSYFIDYLRRTQRLSEALEQARYLQIYLSEEFGEDYMDWLTDAPNAAALCEDLQREMSVQQINENLW